MKKFLKRLLQIVAAMGIVGASTQYALEKNGVDPVSAAAISNQAEKAVDDAAARYGQVEE